MNTDTRQWENSIIVQVLVLFLVGILTTGAITYIAERHLSNDTVMRQTETRADEIADEVTRAVKEYPAYSWLLRYWYVNSDDLDIEYDVGFQSGTRTEEKCAQLLARHPGLPMRYLVEEEILSLPEEDQKLYAEICYTWLLDRVNQIKRSYHIGYLFCVVSVQPYDSQVFLFSAAEEDAVRGTGYTQVYPLGHAVMVGESQRTAMATALESNVPLAAAGDSVDDYTYLCSIDNSVAIQLRASDAVLLAVISGLPIMMDSQLFCRHSTPYYGAKSKVAVPLASLSKEMLEEALQKAVEAEDYEKASQLRDELLRRKKDKDTEKS